MFNLHLGTRWQGHCTWSFRVGAGCVSSAGVPGHTDLHGLTVAHQLVANVQVGCFPEVGFQSLKFKKFIASTDQGCQIVCFLTIIPNLGKFLRTLE
jgi:hypothetical protein